MRNSRLVVANTVWILASVFCENNVTSKQTGDESSEDFWYYLKIGIQPLALVIFGAISVAITIKLLCFNQRHQDELAKEALKKILLDKIVRTGMEGDWDTVGKLLKENERIKKDIITHRYEAGNNNTLLHYASENNKYLEIEELGLASVFNVNIRNGNPDIKGQTPLHLVSCVETARILLEYGAQFEEDQQGKTPLHRVVEKGDCGDELIVLFLDFLKDDNRMISKKDLNRKDCMEILLDNFNVHLLCRVSLLMETEVFSCLGLPENSHINLLINNNLELLEQKKNGIKDKIKKWCYIKIIDRDDGDLNDRIRYNSCKFYTHVLVYTNTGSCHLFSQKACWNLYRYVERLAGELQHDEIRIEAVPSLSQMIIGQKFCAVLAKKNEIRQAVIDFEANLNTNTLGVR